MTATASDNRAVWADGRPCHIRPPDVGHDDRVWCGARWDSMCVAAANVAHWACHPTLRVSWCDDCWDEWQTWNLDNPLPIDDLQEDT